MQKTLQPVKGECYVCGRGGVSLQRVGATLARHDDCAPGSYNWLEWYATLPASKRTDAGDILFNYHKKEHRP